MSEERITRLEQRLEDLILQHNKLSELWNKYISVTMERDEKRHEEFINQLTRVADALEAKKPCTHCGDTVPPTHKVFCSDRCILDEASKLPPFKEVHDKDGYTIRANMLISLDDDGDIYNGYTAIHPADGLVFINTDHDGKIPILIKPNNAKYFTIIKGDNNNEEDN